MNILLNDGSLKFADGLVTYCDDNNQDHQVSLFKGYGYRALVTKSGLTELMRSKRLTAEDLGSTNTGKSVIRESSGTYVIMCPIDSSLITFLSGTPGDWDPNELPDLQGMISTYQDTVDEFNDLFIRIGKLGLYSNPDEEFFFTHEAGVYVPLDDTGEYILQCFFHLDLENYFVNLDNISYWYAGIEYPVPNRALVEITFENHKVVYTDLNDGIDEENHVLIRDRQVHTQNKMVHIEVFYECELVKVLTPIIMPVDGTYFDPITVEITCNTEGATIRYTTDGTNPNESSPLYEGTFVVNHDTVVKAKAWKEGYLPSEIAVRSYRIRRNRVYNRVKYDNGLMDNEVYLIVYDDKNHEAAGKQLTRNRAGVTIVVNNDQIVTAPATSPSENRVFEFRLKYFRTVNGVFRWLFYDIVNEGLLGIPQDGDYNLTITPGSIPPSPCYEWVIDIMPGVGVMEAHTVSSLNNRFLRFSDDKFTGAPSSSLSLYLFKYGNLPAPPSNVFNITINPNLPEGLITCNKYYAYEGDLIKVYIHRTNYNPGQQLVSLYYIIDGRGVPIDLNTKEFLMPAGDIIIDAVFS